MSQINVLDLQGKQVSKVNLNETIFTIETNKKLIHQAVVCQLANARQSNAHTKTRGEVRGGGAKPWKQKGTGRARAGSSNSPIWVGGGIAFGPRNNRNFSQMINKKMKRKALFMALSDKVTENKFIVTKDLIIKEPKTKLMIEILNTLPTSDGTVLIVIEEINDNLQLASKNIPYVKLVKLSSLNIVDVLKFNYILTTVSGLKAIENHFSEISTDEVEEEVKVAKKEIKETEAKEVEAKEAEEKPVKSPAKKPAKAPAKDAKKEK